MPQVSAGSPPVLAVAAPAATSPAATAPDPTTSASTPTIVTLNNHNQLSTDDVTDDLMGGLANLSITGEQLQAGERHSADVALTSPWLTHPSDTAAFLSTSGFLPLQTNAAATVSAVPAAASSSAQSPAPSFGPFALSYLNAHASAYNITGAHDLLPLWMAAGKDIPAFKAQLTTHFDHSIPLAYITFLGRLLEIDALLQFV